MMSEQHDAKTIKQLESQLAEAIRVWEVADDERVTARAQLKAGKKYMAELQAMFDKSVAHNAELRERAEKAETEAIRLRCVLEKAREFTQWRFNKARNGSEEQKRARELLVAIRDATTA